MTMWNNFNWLLSIPSIQTPSTSDQMQMLTTMFHNSCMSAGFLLTNFDVMLTTWNNFYMKCEKFLFNYWYEHTTNRVCSAYILGTARKSPTIDYSPQQKKVAIWQYTAFFV